MSVNIIILIQYNIKKTVHKNFNALKVQNLFKILKSFNCGFLQKNKTNESFINSKRGEHMHKNNRT